MAVERVSWGGGGMEVVALLKEMRGVYAESSDGTMRYEEREGVPAVERVKVTAPTPAHWYDLRTHAYLGEMQEVRAQPEGGRPEAACHAALPGEGPEARPRRRRGPAGRW